MRRVGLVLPAISLLAASAAAWSQAPGPEREIQTGVKTTSEGFATTADVVIEPGQLAQAPQLALAGLQKLAGDTTQAGLTPLGIAQIGLVGVMPPAPDGKVTLQLQVPIIEQPTADDLNGKGPVKVMKLAAAQVAYTYHRGSLDQLQSSFMRLFQWVMGAGKEPAGPPCIIIYSPRPQDPESMAAELQVPVK